MVCCQFRRGIGAVDGEYVRVINPNIGTHDEVEVGVPADGEPHGADMGLSATNEVQERRASAASEAPRADAPSDALVSQMPPMGQGPDRGAADLRWASNPGDDPNAHALGDSARLSDDGLPRPPFEASRENSGGYRVKSVIPKLQLSRRSSISSV